MRYSLVVAKSRTTIATKPSSTPRGCTVCGALPRVGYQCSGCGCDFALDATLRVSSVSCPACGNLVWSSLADALAEFVDG